MWTCNNCENQREENYKFCWSCGNPRESKSESNKNANTAISFAKQMEDEPTRNIPQVKSIEKEKEIKKEPAEDLKPPEPEITTIEPIKPEPEPKSETKPKETEKPRGKIPEPELFATFLPESESESFPVNSASDWENVVFTIAVRILGLYFIFQVLTAIPQFASLFYFYLFNPLAEINSISDLLATDLFALTARLLFYLIVGIYLIAGGGILLRMLPRK